MQYTSRRLKNIAWSAVAFTFSIVCSLPCANAQTANSQVPAADQTQPASTGTPITGFRNAQFGMTQAQVLAAIESEFKVPASAVKQGVNNLQRTNVMNVAVPDLLPGGGTATVSYIFGYQTHKLIEINILWSQATDPKITPAILYENGESLQQYFAGAGYAPDRSTGNIAVPDGILLFRTTDLTGNAIVLTLSGIVKKDPKSDKATLDPTALALAYAADPLHPDVFQLPKGSF
jgi:hypothetical protein